MRSTSAQMRRMTCRLLMLVLLGGTAWAAAPPGRDLKALVDSSSEQMVFRFRTKFNRKWIEGGKTLVAYKTPVPPLLDGYLEDECWKHADRTRNAWVQKVTRDVSPKQTVLYACYDDKNLYLAYVAEEPNLKGVMFIERRKSPDSRRFEAYGGDSGEIFIETDGLGGDGHGWQYIFNIYSNMGYDGLNPYTGEGTNWESGYRVKGALGPRRWVVELAMPFKGYRWKKYAYKGPPQRGEKWGIRVVRNGRPPPSGEDRMESTWTYNPVASWHNPWPTGTLVFDDLNLLRNGQFNELDA